MALSLQNKLELAGALAKVQPGLQRLHLLPPPKKRHRLRNAILLGGVVVACAFVAAGVLRRRGNGIGELPETDEEAELVQAQAAPEPAANGVA